MMAYCYCNSTQPISNWLTLILLFSDLIAAHVQGLLQEADGNSGGSKKEGNDGREGEKDEGEDEELEKPPGTSI